MITFKTKNKMPTKIIKKADVLELSLSEKSTASLQFFVEDGFLVIQEPPTEDNLASFFTTTSLGDWLILKQFIDTQFNSK